MKTYKDIYLRSWSTHKIGIKPILGGTGLGKTSGMIDAITESIQKGEGRKFIYCTYRHNLLQEQEDAFIHKKIGYTYLKSNLDIVVSIFKGKKEKVIFETLSKSGLFNYEAQSQKNESKGKGIDHISNLFNSRLKLIQELEDPTLKDLVSKEMERLAGDFLKFFKNSLKKVRKNNKKLYQNLLLSPIIWELFPYIQFENDPNTRVLLGTIHKFLYGFFDGNQELKITSLKENIIYLDEFDFLEPEILKILSGGPGLQNLIEFVRFFYEDFDYWADKGFWQENPDYQIIWQKLSLIKRFLDEKLKILGFSFPQIRHFRMRDGEFVESEKIRLFQTNKSMVSKKFFLEEENNSWYIREKETKESKIPQELFFILNSARDKILGAFNAFHLNITLIEDIIAFIWNSKNDGTPGVYDKYVKENLLYHRAKGNKPGHGGLKAATGYDLGFRIIKLIRGGIRLDPNGVQIDQLELLTSPESLIAKISDENLVFALSATVDIPRVVRSFNMKWLEENAHFIPFDEYDIKIISLLKEEKGRIRNSNITLKVSEELPSTSSLSTILDHLETIGFFSSENENEFASEFRKSRASRGLQLIKWITTQSNGHSHLIFMSTFSHLKKIILGELPEESLNLKLKEDIHSSVNGMGYSITFQGKSCNVFFLDSSQSQGLHPFSSKTYDFFSAEKSIIITQYNSASNGVNLPCFSVKGEKKDFDGIHLIDGFYHWLPMPGSDFQQKPIEKQLFWYLWKLLQEGEISSSAFRYCLKEYDFKKIKKQYNNTSERTLNCVSLYIQALGRIERSWKLTGKVEVSLSKDVINEFNRFSFLPEYRAIRFCRKNTSSVFIEKILQGSALIHNSSGAEDNDKFISLTHPNQNSIEKVNVILKKLERVRATQGSPIERRKIKEAWEALRKSILQQDYLAEIEFPGLSLSVAKDLSIRIFPIQNNFWMDSRQEILFYKPQSNETQYQWNLNLAFKSIIKNPIISKFFKENEYPLQFQGIPSKGGFIFTPYIYQAILTGAIGEQSVQAIFMHFGIEFQTGVDILDPFFELADIQIYNGAIFIDCKNYSQKTQDKFSLDGWDSGFEPDFTSEKILDNALRKYQKIRSVYGSESKLILLNLICKKGVHSMHFNQKLQRVSSLGEACISIIPGMLQEDNPAELTFDFQALLTLLTQKQQTDKII
ncbi:MAG: hypothetical protein H6581_05455 [Bacteroidia bacterium]|nr:hypothetical protein [Bacteroidia bacterium]